MAADPKKMKVNDRVKRSNVVGCFGTIKEIKSEVSATTQEAREKNIMVNVQWDNGTLSFLSPEALDLVA